MAIAVYVTYKLTKDQFNPNGKIYSAFIDFEDRIDTIKDPNTISIDGVIPGGILAKAKSELIEILGEEVSILSYNIVLGDAMYINPYCTVNDPNLKNTEPAKRPQPTANADTVEHADPEPKEGKIEMDTIPANKVFELDSCMIVDWNDKKNNRHRTIVKVPIDCDSSLEGLYQARADKKLIKKAESAAYDAIVSARFPELKGDYTKLINEIQPLQYKFIGSSELIVSEEDKDE